jgi:rhomboid family GlyGly-CTERM serine protease
MTSAPVDGSSTGPRCWLAGTVVLAAGALAVAAAGAPATALDWQPGLAGREPWRWWTAAWVHGSRWHLGANLAGTVVVGLLGAAARVPPRAALAWALAWPLTQLGWLLGPPLAHFGGLSGVLHAGVAVVALELCVHGRGARRAIGLLLLAGLVAKIGLEAPWGPALREAQGWGVSVAPWSHASGALAGLLTGAVAMALPTWRPPTRI